MGGRVPRPAASRLRRPAGLARPALVAALAVAVVALSACGSDATDTGDAGQATTGPGAQVATVSYQGRVYLVDCTPVAVSRLGAALQVAPEQASAQLSEARSVSGVDPSEGFAVAFSNAVCGGQGPQWVAAIAAEIARSDPARTRSIRDLMRSG